MNIKTAFGIGWSPKRRSLRSTYTNRCEQNIYTKVLGTDSATEKRHFVFYGMHKSFEIQ